MDILNFEPKMCVKISNLGLIVQLTVTRAIFDIGWVVDKYPVYTMKGQ